MSNSTIPKPNPEDHKPIARPIYTETIDRGTYLSGPFTVWASGLQLGTFGEEKRAVAVAREHVEAHPEVDAATVVQVASGVEIHKIQANPFVRELKSRTATR